MEQSLLVKPVIGRKQGRPFVALCFDMAYKFGCFLQVPFSVVQGVDETAVRQNSHKRPPVSLIC